MSFSSQGTRNYKTAGNQAWGNERSDSIVSTLSIGLVITKHRLWNKDCAEKCIIIFMQMCFNARCLSNSHVPIARARHDEINIRQSLTSTHKAARWGSGNPRLTSGAALKYSLQKWKFEAKKKNQFACSSLLERNFRLF